MTWIFLEYIAGRPLDRSSRSDRILSSRWLACLHAETAGAEPQVDLQTRGSAEYKESLGQAMVGITDVLSNQALTKSDRSVLIQIIEHLSALNEDWDEIEAAGSGLPSAVLHGDFVPKNLVVRNSGTKELHPIDWATAHWGLLAGDLEDVDVAAYRDAFSRHRVPPARDELSRAKSLGVLFRTISAVGWAVPHLSYDWVDRGMRWMRSYLGTLEKAGASRGWLG